MKKYYKKGFVISLATVLMLGTASVDMIPFHIVSYAKTDEENILTIEMKDKTEKGIENSTVRFNSEMVTMGTERDFKIDENGVLTRYHGNGGRVMIPEGVICIGEYAFSHQSNITEVVFSNGITHIESGAFSNCSGLTKITFSESLTSIGNGAFENCSSLTNVTLPEGVTNMGEAAFRKCSSLKEITLSKELHTIERCF